MKILYTFFQLTLFQATKIYFLMSLVLLNNPAPDTLCFTAHVGVAGSSLCHISQVYSQFLSIISYTLHYTLHPSN